MVGIGFLVALEFAARHYGLPGPIASQAREVIFAPASGFLLYASMGLMLVVLTWRQRFIAVGTAIGIDLVILLVRWVADAPVTQGHPFGNGALWVILGCAVIAVTRRTGRERVLLLKGVGLGLLLVTGRKTGDTWLLITSKTRPLVLDQYVATADHALGNPSWLVGRMVRATGSFGEHFLNSVYTQLAVAAVVVALYQLRNVADERRFPSHHLVRTFLVIGLLGPAIYMIFPVVGPVFAYGADGGQWAMANIWPDTMPPHGVPQHMPFDGITPRNCMPSLHTAWATTIFIHSRKGPWYLRFAGAFWLVATLAATLGFGYHYGIDIITGVIFTVTIETALRSLERGWDRSATRLVAYGTTVFAAILVATRYLPTQLGDHPWLSGPLLMLATASVVYGYVRTTRQWEPKAAPVRRPELQPELV
ncbi:MULTISPECIES: phosphatase PAP2 family protein [unclassified Streptomyces]|uniref:phosphatase PAP2 family protein n=1 Tax=unclassified Streptomyces TaxID=2593676 RepID=UPI00225C001C|nr:MULTISPECIES: phosphatase PAP2 family protein [unclassified Streptomyces]MCX5139444.1 phosphatase PAP2 family protein [Streptomyces sp. NBC_00338]WRZ69824.1 phosphatase PAP2 family protein [Streptomyces sp. NBC_01257]WSU63687.1 phosphatase PAP2 family protein [Streptomyces sp. NBC_01104]